MAPKKTSRSKAKMNGVSWLLNIPAAMIYFSSLVIIGLFFGLGFKLGSITAQQITGKEGMSGGKELVLVYMNNCGHCKTMMPEWEKATKKNNTGIRMRKVEMNEKEGQVMCKRHNIQGFPTIILLDKGEKVKDYDGDRNEGAFIEFLKLN